MILLAQPLYPCRCSPNVPYWGASTKYPRSTATVSCQILNLRLIVAQALRSVGVVSSAEQFHLVKKRDIAEEEWTEANRTMRRLIGSAIVQRVS